SLTVLNGSNKTNVIPAEASADLDIRLLPDADPAELLGTLQRLVSDTAVHWTPLLAPKAPLENPIDTDLFHAIERAARERDPDAGEVLNLQIDHVTVAGSDLALLQRAFAEAGLPTDYGGLHSNGVTHMALLGFEDGSYLELISTVKAGAPSPWWPRQIVEDGGPCAWCARVDDLAAECARLSGLGILVQGPTSFHRERPDGARVEWDLAFLGTGERGAV